MLRKLLSSLHNLQVEIYTFFKAIYRMWVACGQYSELDPLDVKDELFDLVKPRDPLRITLQDLVVSAVVLAAVLSATNRRTQYSAHGHKCYLCRTAASRKPTKSLLGDWLLCWCNCWACSILHRVSSHCKGLLDCCTRDVERRVVTTVLLGCRTAKWQAVSSASWQT